MMKLGSSLPGSNVPSPNWLLEEADLQRVQNDVTVHPGYGEVHQVLDVLAEEEHPLLPLLLPLVRRTLVHVLVELPAVSVVAPERAERAGAHGDEFHFFLFFFLC